MAPLPQNNTARIFYDYITGNSATSREHTVAFRTNGEEENPATLMDGLFLAMLTGWGANQFRSGWKVLRARFQSAGAAFSTPYQPTAALLAFSGTGNDVAYSPSWEAIEDTIQGRSPSSGRRVDFSIYRANGPVDGTFRYGMPGGVQTALGQMVTAGLGVVIDNSRPIWYTYVNQNFNSYWERALRS